jgi:hypothetical protein
MMRPVDARVAPVGDARGTRDSITTDPAAPSSPLGALGGFAVRPLGVTASDLALELSDPVTPAAVTGTLAACLQDPAGHAPPASALAAAPVGDRTAAFMAIAAATGDGTFSIPLRCPIEGCRDDLEVEVTWEEIRTIAAATAAGPFEVDAGGVRYVVRRPTGADQDAWAGAASPGDRLTTRDVLGRLIVDGPIDRLTTPRVAAIEAALDEGDPLVTFGMSVTCPACGRASPHELSLVAAGAVVLRRRQAAVLDDIHELAHAYGWSEPAILAIPAWRRAAYRARIAGAG